jgi:sigma-B regulation protein RsbQ
MRPKIDVLKRNNVRVEGNPNASRTLLFAHGFGTDQTAWKRVWPTFKDDYQIVLVDMVGANETTVKHFSAERYSHLSAFADDLLDVVETLDLWDVILVGHSVGGMTGILASIEEPTRFAGVVLISASPRYLDDENYTGGFSQADLTGLFAQMTSNYYTWASGFAPRMALNQDAPQIATYFVETLSNMRPDVGLATARTIFQSDHRADLPKLSHPTLILQPQIDGAVPGKVGQFMAHTIPQAQLLVLPTEGHLPHLSHPDEINKAIRNFIDLIPAYGLESV